MYAFTPSIKRVGPARGAPQQKDIGSLMSDLLIGALTAAGIAGTFAVGSYAGEWTAQALDSLRVWLFDEREAIYRRQDAINARFEELDRLDPQGADPAVAAEVYALEAEMDQLWARIDKITAAEIAAEEERRNSEGKTRFAPQRRRVERKLVAESLAVIAGMVAGGFLGSTLAELYVWLTDQETYWSAKLDEALHAADEAKQKLAAIDQARAQAEAEAAQNPEPAGWW